MKKIMYVICFAGIVVQSCNHPQPVTDNPFLIPFDTPFEVPPFDKIQNRHYLPAFREGIKEQEAEIQAILKNPEAPTFANTCLLYTSKQPGKLTVTFHCIEIHGRFGMQQLSELTDLPPFFYRKGFGIKGR